MAGLTTGTGTDARTNAIAGAKEEVMVRGRGGWSVCARAACAGAMVLVGAMGACTSQVPVSDGAYTATYTGTTLSGTIDGARVPSVIAATEQAMLARGYSIVESSSTEESGEIIGRPPRYNNYPRMKVGAARAGEGVRVSLTYEPFGDKEVSAAMYDAILRRLGK